MDRPVIYVHPTQFPALTANSVQVTAMCEAFGRSADTYLATFANTRLSVENPYEYFGVAKTFEILWLPGRHRDGTRVLASVKYLLQRFGRNWIAVTRVPTVAAVTSALGVHTVLELHDLPTIRLQRASLRISVRLRHLLFLVVISEQLRADLLEQGFGIRQNVSVLHDGAHLTRTRTEQERRAARLRFSLPIDRKLVGYAGSLKADKGVEILLGAAQKVSPAQFVVVGGSPPDQLERFKSEYPDVIFLGQITPAEVADFLSACDVLAAPFIKAANLQLGDRSIEIYRYMSPLKVFEAMASGTPLVVSDLPVLREVLRPDETCLMVEAGDSGALADGIERVLEDAALARRLAQAARRDVENYSWDRRATAILEAAHRRTI